jgi:transposase InsO family protein
MTQDPLGHRRVFDTRDDLDRAAALRAGFDVHLENPLEALHPAHRRLSLGRCAFLFSCRLNRPGTSAPASRRLGRACPICPCFLIHLRRRKKQDLTTRIRDTQGRPRSFSDNGASYISIELADWLEGQGLDHVREAPYHPQTQGKIERFIDHYNHHRYHESLKNLTPADVYFGRGDKILQKRAQIKRKTIKQRRLLYQMQAAKT